MYKIIMISLYLVYVCMHTMYVQLILNYYFPLIYVFPLHVTVLHVTMRLKSSYIWSQGITLEYGAEGIAGKLRNAGHQMRVCNSRNSFWFEVYWIIFVLNDFSKAFFHTESFPHIFLSPGHISMVGFNFNSRLLRGQSCRVEEQMANSNRMDGRTRGR